MDYLFLIFINYISSALLIVRNAGITQKIKKEVKNLSKITRVPIKTIKLSIRPHKL